MKGSLIDSNVILDLFLNDPQWADWSQSILERQSELGPLYINSIIYSEISIGFEQIEELESAIDQCGFTILDIPKEALFLAGKVFLRYRKNKGVKRSPLPDFYIGAQAVILDMCLVTRDIQRYRSYDPAIQLIDPEGEGVVS